ncbi:hypothetical protein [Streptomyces bullii]|uniref:Uncharacterized protein n=1 Tax=Streptomyces bullii TaxID=349910 RepID=A0ABW0V408_9ACTN
MGDEPDRLQVVVEVDCGARRSGAPPVGVAGLPLNSPVKIQMRGDARGVLADPREKRTQDSSKGCSRSGRRASVPSVLAQHLDEQFTGRVGDPQLKTEVRRTGHEDLT